METNTQYQQLYQSYKAHNQEHVFKFWKELNEEQQRSLLTEAASLELESLFTSYQSAQHKLQALKHTNVHTTSANIQPFTNVTNLSTTDPSTRSAWYIAGLKSISQNEVGVVLMAGGQGTRLGSDLPKGCFFIGLPSGKSLFQLQAERIKRLIHLAAEVSGKSTDSIHLPWYIMTSKATHEATISYFEQVHFFQLPRDDIYFFQQRELPAIRLDGKIIMESKYQMALSPNGNGGIFDALVQHGILANMKQRGLKHCHIYGVDNVLVKVADPTLIGFASDKNIQCVNKVVLKEDPSEKVGVMAVKNERCTIVEYSELSEAMASLRNPNGELTYNAGNIVQHYFSVDFLQTIVGNQLEYHLATKAIPLINEEGNVIAPSTPNGTKLEMFIFDIFERISLTQIAAFVVNRVEEFAAVKNKSGVDSPETARTLLSNYHKVLATTAGARFHDHEPSSLFEISPLVSYAGEDLEKLCRGQSFQLPCNLESNASI